MKGLFLTLEGGEGCGKSTQARRLSERLSRLGWRVTELREPGGTPLAEEIRQILKHSPAGRGMTSEAELLLMNAARAQLVREVIRPALANGEVVVCDRFSDSTTAYQGWGRGLDLRRVADVVDFAIGDTRPDLTLLLRVSPGVAAARRAQRAARDGATGSDRFEAEEEAFFERVDKGFSALAAAEPERFRVVDAGADVESVAGLIWKAVEAKLAECAPSIGPGGAESRGDESSGGEMSR